MKTYNVNIKDRIQGEHILRYQGGIYLFDKMYN